MKTYTLEYLITLDDHGLKKAAREAFSMLLDPYSALGRRHMTRCLAEAGAGGGPRHLSDGIAFIIGSDQTEMIENILAYQEARERIPS